MEQQDGRDKAIYAGHWDGVYSQRPEQRTREWHCELKAVRVLMKPYLRQAIGDSSLSTTHPPKSGDVGPEVRTEHEQLSPAETETGQAPVSYRRALLVDVGCGGSSMAADIRDSLGPSAGLHLLLTDISSVIIDVMAQRYSGDPTVQCAVADCRSLPLPTGAADVVLDKGTIDALYGDEDKIAMLSECSRVLAPNGVILSISFGAVARLAFLAKACPQLGLMHRAHVVGKGDPMSGHQVVFFAAIARSFTQSAGDYEPDRLTRTVLDRVKRTGSMYDDETEDEATAWSVFP